jgi:hypothetical protein
MSAQPSVTTDQHNFSNLHLIRANALNHQRIPGPDSRKHAPTRRRKTKFSEGPQNLAGKIAFHSRRGFTRAAVNRTHDTFRFNAQPLCDGLILPHDSAEVTKTCS